MSVALVVAVAVSAVGAIVWMPADDVLPFVVDARAEGVEGAQPETREADLELDAPPERVAVVPLVAEPVQPAEPEPVALDVAEVMRLLDDLRDDDVKWNATHAQAVLRAAHESVTPFLERALTSDDVQQRDAAALVLRARGEPATAILAEVSVAHTARQRSSQVYSVTQTVRYLCRHTAEAERQLRWGLGSRDSQQRFLCAYILAQGGFDDPAARGILVDHLRDNHIAGDALMAVHGLTCLGEAVLPTVYGALERADSQSRKLLLSIERAILGDAAKERLGRELTTVYWDPARQFDITRSPVATW